MYLTRFLRYWASKILRSRPWPFGVTWRHQSRDYWTPAMQFLIGGPLKPSRRCWDVMCQTLSQAHPRWKCIKTIATDRLDGNLALKRETANSFQIQLSQAADGAEPSTTSSLCLNQAHIAAASVAVPDVACRKTLKKTMVTCKIKHLQNICKKCFSVSLYRPKPIHCNYQFVHYSAFRRISPSILNWFTPNLHA